MAKEKVEKGDPFCVYCNATVTVGEYRARHMGGSCVGRSNATKAARQTIAKMVDDIIREREADRLEAERLETLAKSVGERELFMTYTRRADALRRKWKVSK